MKLFLSLLFLFSLGQSDEMQRLNDIVKDIENLRLNYDHSQEQLQECQVNYSDVQQKNALLLKEIKNDKSSKIQDLEKQIISLKKSLKVKDEKIALLEKGKKEKSEIKLKNKCNLENQINNFPKLQMRSSKKITTKATTYRLAKESDIYADIDADVIEKWEIERSFTSTMIADGWVKITGYFVNKKWQKAKRSMWVKAANVIKRD